MLISPTTMYSNKDIFGRGYTPTCVKLVQRMKILKLVRVLKIANIVKIAISKSGIIVKIASPVKRVSLGIVAIKTIVVIKVILLGRGWGNRRSQKG